MDDQKGAGASGRSGRRLAVAIIVIGVTAGTAGLIFRQFTPRTEPATRPTDAAPATTSSAEVA
jgi:hypothetical protein